MGALTHQRDPHAQGGSVDAEILQDVKAQKADHSQARPVAGVVELPGNPQTASQSGGQERTGAPGPGLGPEPLPVSQCTCWLRDLRQVTEWPSGLVFPFKQRGGGCRAPSPIGSCGQSLPKWGPHKRIHTSPQPLGLPRPSLSPWVPVGSAQAHGDFSPKTHVLSPPFELPLCRSGLGSEVCFCKRLWG